jgi:predicted DNA-binding transcriptional regulator AlpA
MNISKLLSENAVLPLWPEVGQLLGLSRTSAYKAAETGAIKTISIGRLKKVPVAWLRRKLEIDAPTEAA